MRSRLARAMLLAAAILAVRAPAARAQVSTGRIDVTVVDPTGGVLAGATVEVSGPLRQSAVTDGTGEAHFLNLPPGVYTVTAKASGFSDYLNKNVFVATGGGVPLKIAMTIAGVATQVQVTREAPVVDTKRTGTATNVSLEELQNIPSARDPWVVLQTVPGVIVDRVNVGGAESGQQSNYQAKGASGGENTWNIDGIAVTDMASLGGTPAYYDFDMFQDMQVSMGGADVTKPTPGVQLNMVLKNGTNTPRGTARFYFENQDLQANNLSSELARTIGGDDGKGNRMHLYQDYGVEFGGPIVRDRLWAWGGLGKTHIDLITLNGTHDRTELKDASFKGTAEITNGIRGNYTFFRGAKDKFARGVSPTVSDESAHDQTGPTTLNKGEGTFVVGGNLFLAVRAAHVASRFSLLPRGGSDAQMYVDDGGVTRGSSDSYFTERPQSNVTFDANSFHGHHELKFGFAWRKASVDSSDAFPGNGLVTQHNGYPDMVAKITRAGHAVTSAVYVSGYAGDTWSVDRLTVNMGLRWDRQAASLGSSSVPGSPVLPSLLPAVSATPIDDAIVWNAVSPRLGVSYAVNERKTVARASYAAFASQLNATAAATVSAIQYSAIYYYAFDTNLNRIAEPNEIFFGRGHIGYYGFDPLDPHRTTSVNQIGPYATPRTHEIMAGLEHELMPHFGIIGTFTYRRFTHFNWLPHIGVTSADYVQTGVLVGSADVVGPFSIPFYALDPAAVPPGGGRSYEERRGYHQRYLGFETSAVKRMSNRWMARFGFSTNDHREYFDGPDALEDPTPTLTALAANPNRNGGIVVTETTGNGKSNIFMILPRFQIIANGLFQGPWGINLGANWVLRQGYSRPYYRSDVATGDPLSNLKDLIVVDDVGDFRLPRVSSLDARVERTLRFKRASLTLDFDIFNVTNAATVLGKQYDLRRTGPTGYNQVLEVMNPRIVRLGARVNF